MNTVEIIKKKRDGKKLSRDEISFLVDSYTEKKIPDYQFSAFLMAAYLKGMDTEETSFLTNAMLHSGIVIDLSEIPGAKIDKHSTGGVGDKTSLILAPICAAAGVKVPMISGRGLGHTGGTLDKLEAIPGFRTDLNLNEYKSVLNECGAVLIGQTTDIAPADKLIYALRDVTATVESIPLITGSIMSKKLAEGIDGLVLDIKTGNGAFMKTEEDSLRLAESLINTAKSFDKKVIGFITDMSQPLGNYVGNWFEVLESVNVLRGEDVPDLNEVSFTLSGAMIYLGGKAESIEEGIEISKEMIKNGKALEIFMKLAEMQGGDVKYLKNPDKYPKSEYCVEVKSTYDGYISGIDNYGVGMAALELGAGRLTKEDIIDPKAGVIFKKKTGDLVSKGDVVAELYSDKKEKIEEFESKFIDLFDVTEEKVLPNKLIKHIIK